MALQKLSLKSNHHHENKRLDDVLAEWLPTAIKQPVSKGKIRKLIMAGAVYLNGRRVQIASKEIRSNALVQVYLDLQKLNSDQKSQDKPFEMDESRVIFEDEYIIVVDKPPGLPTQPTLDESRNNLFASVKKFLAKRQNVSITEVYLGLHHRLDRDTSGLLLLTKSQKANPGVAALFTNHEVSKIYQALTLPLSVSKPGQEPETEWTVKNYLGKAKDAGKKNRYCSVRSGGDFAHTDFRLLEKLPSADHPSAYWVEAKPLTGRTHQIRVHLSEGGMPIFGDQTYGQPEKMRKLIIPRLMLHAASLTFPHPVHHNKISVRSQLPEDFNQCMQALRKGVLGS